MTTFNATALWIFLFLTLSHTVGSVSRGPQPATPLVLQSNATDPQVESFLSGLQKAVASNDKRRVATMIRYPIIFRGRPPLLIKTPAALVVAYDRIFTPSLRRMIAEARADSLFRNWQGVMINRGEIWFDLDDSGQVRITALNGPPQGEARKGSTQPQPSPAVLKLDPRVFSLFGKSGPNSDVPLVTEINLDAVEQDHDRFKPADVKKDADWFTVAGDDGHGFFRYQILKQVGNRYTTEYQENSGGTLTESAIIEFVIEKRDIKEGTKLISTRVLRILAYTVK